MTAPIRSMLDRNTRERNRLRAKRRNPGYLRRQRANRARQMRATRALRKQKGLCRECEKKALHDHAYCREHLLYERHRESK
jgi:hypothetical protein